MLSFRCNRIIAMVCGLFLMGTINSVALAADFIDATVESVVGQRVSGFIELPQVSAADLASLKVRLASRSTYSDNGVAYYSVHQTFLFQPKELADGSVQLDISSESPLREPELNLLLRMTWRDGDLLQGLTLNVPFTQAALGADNTVLTTSSDNLWRLAGRTRDGSRVSISQQMLAIQRLNPNAFNNDNINGLKKGFLLRIPNFMEAVAVDKKVARNTVESQHSQWRNYQKSDRKSIQKDLDRSSDKTAPVPFELGADLPPVERRGEVRIFQPEATIEIEVGFDSELSADKDISGQSLTLFEDFPASGQGDASFAANLAEEIANNPNSDSEDDSKLVNIDQSVNDQIDLIMAEETQGSYSAQVVWFVAGGILGILIIVMLLRRQMAERKKNLEDAWVGEAESDGGDSRWLDENPLEDGHLDALDSDTERQAKENPAESLEEGAQTIEAPISVQGQEGSFPAEPSIAPVEEAAPATTETNETFLDSLDADEMPLEETSNTEVYTTRLKLAEAYLEMGDETGARDMLEEVEAEGDDAQKALAKSIIQRIDDALDDSKDT